MGQGSEGASSASSQRLSSRFGSRCCKFITETGEAEDGEPIRPAQFSTRKIALFVLVMTLATALTIWGTFYVWETFVLSNHNDPLTKSGGLSPMQERAQRSK
jgi:hypothetical protein